MINFNFFFINNIGLYPLKITGIQPNASSISFNFSEPKDCYSAYYITCSNNNDVFLNATLRKTSFSGECDLLMSGTNYTIKSTVYDKRNEMVNEEVSVCTSSQF